MAKGGEVFYVRIVTAHEGGEFSAAPDIRLSPEAAAIDEAERLQEAFDRDCDPKRAYVLDETRVPVKAAGVPQLSCLESVRGTQARRRRQRA